MTRIITRYPNRKLYDSEVSGYVSLADVAALVRQGVTVQIVDKKTGEDLTAQMLTQIILDEGKQGQPLIPTDLLHDLLRRSRAGLDERMDHIRGGVDELMQSSLKRLGQVLPVSQTRELEQLKHHLGSLEQLLSRLENRAGQPAAKASDSKDGSTAG